MSTTPKKQKEKVYIKKTLSKLFNSIVNKLRFILSLITLLLVFPSLYNVFYYSVMDCNIVKVVCNSLLLVLSIYTNRNV